MSTLIKYVSKVYPFMLRPYDGDVSTKVSDVLSISDAMPSIVKASLGFLLMNFVIDKLTPVIFPLYWKSLPEKKKGEIAAYMTSLVHHLYVVPSGIIFILNDINRSAGARGFDYDYKLDMIPFIAWVGGYLVSDMIYFAFPDALKGKFEMFGHHILGLGLVFMSFFLTSSIARFVPHLLICEASGIVFNLAWLVKTFGQSWADGKTVIFLEYMFAVFFTLTRVVNMPFVVIGCVVFAETARLRAMIGALMGAVQLLQFYWFYAIIRALKKKENARSDAKATKKVT